MGQLKKYLAEALDIPVEHIILDEDESPAVTKSYGQGHGLVILLQGAYPGMRRSGCGGFERMLWLRLREKFTEPILLLGIGSAGDILKERPGLLALVGPGNRYETLPLAPGKEDELQAWLKEPTGLSTEDLHGRYEPYISAAFDVARSRHSLANVFGLKTIWDIHQCVDKSFTDAYPQKLFDALGRLDAHVAIALLQNEPDKVRKAVEEYSAELQERLKITMAKLKELMVKLRKGKDDVTEYEQWMAHSEALVRSGRANLRFLPDPAERQDSQREIDKEQRNYLEANVEASKALETLNQQLTEFQDEHRKYQREINLTHRAHQFDLQGIKEIRKGLRTTPNLTALQVLHVDDEGQSGWSAIFKHMLHGDESSATFLTPDPHKVVSGTRSMETMEQAIAHLADEVGAFCNGYDCNVLAEGDPARGQIILLDLRLFPAFDIHWEHPAQMSGALLLKKIREWQLTVPVVITTASNKIWSYQTMMELGADAFWIKEGLDIEVSLKESIQNYGNLKELAAGAMHPILHALRRLERAYHEVTTSTTPWWETGIWRTGEKRNGDTATARLFHYSAIQQLRQYCQRYIFASRANQKIPDEGNSNIVQEEQKHLLLASVANQIGSLVESIIYDHDYQGGYAIDMRSRVRYYSPGSEILRIRAQASHKSSWYFSEEQFLLQVELIIELLHVAPRSTVPALDRDKEFEAFVVSFRDTDDTAEITIYENGRQTTGLVDIYDRGGWYLRRNDPIKVRARCDMEGAIPYYTVVNGKERQHG